MSENPRHDAAKSMVKTIHLLGGALLLGALYIHYQVLASMSFSREILNPLVLIIGPRTVTVPWNPYGPILATAAVSMMLAVQFLKDPSVITDVWLSEKEVE